MTSLIFVIILAGVVASGIVIANSIRKSADNESLFDDD